MCLSRGDTFYELQWLFGRPDTVRTLKSLTKSKAAETPSQEALPLQHVAVIMDGNRRWAEQKGLARLVGHRQGVKTLKTLVRHVGERGLKYLTVYAFSSENWQRSQEEVQYLFQLFANVLRDEFDEITSNQVKLSFIGDLAGIPTKLRNSLEKSMQKTASNKGLSLQVALNYGGRLEIVEAVREIAQQVKAGKLSPEQIDEALLSSHLYTKNLPDPELIIRTGGEYRLSNYLLWQSAYTEIYVTPRLWPDFTPADFELAVSDFKQRVRRYGA